jgi:hypothetical protein
MDRLPPIHPGGVAALQARYDLEIAEELMAERIQQELKVLSPPGIQGDSHAIY